MSRAALNRALQVKARAGRLFSDPFDVLADYQPDEEHKAAALPIHGNERTLNMEGILATNIVQSRHFEEAILPLSSPEEVWEEVQRSVDTVEPMQPGTARTPTEAFMLLFRLGVMRLTRKQMYAMINHRDSAYVRALGYLYLRYTCPPSDLWMWCEAAVDDPTPFQPAGEHRGGTM